MRKSSLLKFIFIPFGIALLFAGLFFDGGNAQSPVGLQTTPAPTPDRLAEPTLPAQPSQADLGAQVYWLSCLPCHGDNGQGLTDEFRAVYPTEDQNCWESGCHGAKPYESGFTIPKFIPAVIGPTALAKFSNAAQLNSYIRAAMPFWKPGSLTEEDAWKVTAFVLRENRLWNDTLELNATNASGVAIPRGMLIQTPTPQQAEVPKRSAVIGWIALIGSISILVLLIFILKKSRNTTTI